MRPRCVLRTEITLGGSSCCSIDLGWIVAVASTRRRLLNVCSRQRRRAVVQIQPTTLRLGQQQLSKRLSSQLIHLCRQIHNVHQRTIAC